MFVGIWRKAELFYCSSPKESDCLDSIVSHSTYVLTNSYGWSSLVINTDSCLLPDTNNCKPKLCPVKFVFLMSLILQFLRFYSCFKHFIILEDSVFHQKCRSNLSKNSVPLMWLQLQQLLFSFAKWICLYIESFVIC